MVALAHCLMLLLTMAAGWSFAQTPLRSSEAAAAAAAAARRRSAIPSSSRRSRSSAATTQVVEEVRVNGELRYVRVTPRHGRPYYLVPDVNGATFIRRDSLDSSLKVPMWVLFSF